MTAEVLLIIKEDGEEITRIKYFVSSSCPVKANAVIDVSELLDGMESEKNNIAYLKNVEAVYDIIKRNKKEDMLSYESISRFEFSVKIIKALKYEQIRRKRIRLSEENECEAMINAAKRIISIIEKNNLEKLSCEDITVMKRYLFNLTPSAEKLKSFPDDLKELIKPAFEVMKILIELSPTENDKAFIKKIDEILYM